MLPIINSLKLFIFKVNRKIRLFFPLQNVNHTQYDNNCLLVYIRAPFLKGVQEGVHQNVPQTREIARLIGEFGYNVDVINYFDKFCFFRRKYDAVFDICVSDNPIYWKHLNQNAKKIVYFTGSESRFEHVAEMRRIQNVRRRRNILLQPRSQAPLISKKVEEFDLAVLIGNAYNLRTYSSFRLNRTWLVPNTGYSFDFDKEGIQSANRFIYFGSSCSVHKGLDLLLEVFSEPDFPAELYVCGSFESEQDFVDAYREELYATSNIIPVGYVDIWSDKFKEIVSKCAYTILPSCSEGQAGSITTMMSAGVIPICSKECGFDEGDVFLLADCELETIRSTVLEFSQMDQTWVDEQSKHAKDTVQTKFSVANFTEQMKHALGMVL